MKSKNIFLQKYQHIDIHSKINVRSLHHIYQRTNEQGCVFQNAIMLHFFKDAHIEKLITKNNTCISKPLKK